MRELEIAEARPLAERGAVFRAEWLDKYFRRQAWYRPTGFDPRRLSSAEKARIAALARYRAALSPVAIAKKQEELLQRQRSSRLNCPQAVSVMGEAKAARAVVLENAGVRSWDLAAGTSRVLPPTPGGNNFLPSQVAITADGTRVRAVEDLHQSSQVSSWEWSTWRALPAFQWVDTSARYHVASDSYTLSADGSTVLVLDPSRRAWKLVWLDEPKRRLTLPAAPMLTAATRVSKSSDASQVLAVAAGRAWLWPGPGRKRADGEVEMGKPIELARASDADLAPDGRSVAVVGDAVYPYVSRTNAQKPVKSLVSSIRGGFEFVAFSPNGDKVVAGNDDMGVAVWEASSGKLVYERRERALSLDCAGQWAAFLPDGEHLALAGEMGGFEIVDVRTGKPRVIAAERPLPSLEDERIEAALLARATRATMSGSELSELSFEEQPLLLEQPLTEAELVRIARSGADLRALETLIQARRGRAFRSPRWKAYAEAQRWYRPDSGYDARLTQLDRENLALLKRVREKVNPRPPSPPPDIVANAPKGAFPACPTGSTRIDRVEGARESAACVAKRQGKDVLEGPEWSWLPTGRLGEAHAWLAGQRHGPAMSWYFTGARRSEGAYSHGVRDGTWRTYHPNGRLALHANFQQDVPNGAWTTYYDNGHRALALVFSAGAPDPSVPVDRFAPDGGRWPAATKLACDDTGCGTAVDHLDFESLPPLRAETCSYGGSTFDKPLPRAAWSPVLTATKRAWPVDAGGGAIPGPHSCVDSVRLACARDLDGDARAEVLAEVSYRIVFGSQRGCHAKTDVESWAMRAVVALSPPASGTKAWSSRGVVAYPRCGADVCPGDDTPKGFVLLPSGETAIHVAVRSGGGDCAETEHEEIRTLRGGVWKAVARRTTRACDGTRDAAENDVY